MSRIDKSRLRLQMSWTQRVNYMREAWYIAQNADICRDVSDEARGALVSLDTRRRTHQNALYEIFKKHADVCKVCGALCCVTSGESSHYYSIDFWLRRYTTAPIPELESIWVKNPAIASIRQSVGLIIRSKALGIFGITALREAFRADAPKTDPQKCMYLNQDGCVLEPSDRPIGCVAYTCGRLFESFDVATLREGNLHMQALMSVHKDALSILRKEKKLGFASGRLRLASLRILRISGMIPLRPIRRVF